ncbi:MAG: hypothetical protein E7473_00465 [Ruminococcaceae bacterium]|nr:hypothetical protein [Oscillospiraceae bacterium]
MKKNDTNVALIFGITLFIFALAFIIIPFPKNATSWISFSFVVVSMAAGFGIIKYAFSGEETLKSKFYGVPIAKIGIVYPCAQIIICVILSAIAAFVELPYWIPVLLSVVLLGAAAIGVIATSAVKVVLEEREAEEREVTKKVKLYNLDISYVVDVCKDMELKKDLTKLAEDFRYSDPVSSEATEEIEQRLTDELADLRTLVEANSKQEAMEEINKISILLSERNRICKAFK